MTKQKDTTKKRGDYGESIACRYLEERGFLICERNYMPARGIKRGEIDVIAQKDDVIHFVEVKTRFVRTNHRCVDPPEAQITQQKLRALDRTAQVYLKEKKIPHGEYRFDALSIVIDCTQKNARVRFLQDIFL